MNNFRFLNRYYIFSLPVIYITGIPFLANAVTINVTNVTFTSSNNDIAPYNKGSAAIDAWKLYANGLQRMDVSVHITPHCKKDDAGEEDVDCASFLSSSEARAFFHGLYFRDRDAGKNLQWMTGGSNPHPDLNAASELSYESFPDFTYNEKMLHYKVGMIPSVQRLGSVRKSPFNKLQKNKKKNKTKFNKPMANVLYSSAETKINLDYLLVTNKTGPTEICLFIPEKTQTINGKTYHLPETDFCKGMNPQSFFIEAIAPAPQPSLDLTVHKRDGNKYWSNWDPVLKVSHQSVFLSDYRSIDQLLDASVNGIDQFPYGTTTDGSNCNDDHAWRIGAHGDMYSVYAGDMRDPGKVSLRHFSNDTCYETFDYSSDGLKPVKNGKKGIVFMESINYANMFSSDYDSINVNFKIIDEYGNTYSYNNVDLTIDN